MPRHFWKKNLILFLHFKSKKKNFVEFFFLKAGRSVTMGGTMTGTGLKRPFGGPKSHLMDAIMVRSEEGIELVRYLLIIHLSLNLRCYAL